MAKFLKIFDNVTPGKGIPKNEKEVKGIKRFFLIIKEKFWKLIQLNLLYFVFALPVLVLFYFISQTIIPINVPPISHDFSSIPFFTMWGGLDVSSGGALTASGFWTDFVVRLAYGTFLTATPLLAIGPFQCGFTYIMQCFVKREPVFMKSDFFGKAKANMKQSLIISIIDMIVVFIVALDIKIYIAFIQSGNNNFIISFATCMLAIFSIVYILMHMYIYPILVTFNVTLKQLYKNALLLSMSSLLPGIGIIILDAALILGVTYIINNVMYAFFFVLFFALWLIGLINNYFVYPRIKKALIDPAMAAMEREEASDEDRIFTDRV